MKKRVILGVVFYLFVCFRFFFFLVVRGNLTYVSHVYILLLTLCFLDLFSLGISYCFPVFTFTVESFSVFFCFLHFCSDESLALVPMHTVGGNKLFCFSFNKHTPSKKKLYTIFRCTFSFSFLYNIKQHWLLLGGQFLLVAIGPSNLIDRTYSTEGGW